MCRTNLGPSLKQKRSRRQAEKYDLRQQKMARGSISTPVKSSIANVNADAAGEFKRLACVF